MSKKEKFIEEIENAGIELSEEAAKYFEELKNGKETKDITENGKKLLAYLQGTDKILSAKKIGEELGISSRGVSGAMRALVTRGLVAKMGQNPVNYQITDLGKAHKLD